jgi:hypothetical protein
MDGKACRRICGSERNVGMTREAMLAVVELCCDVRRLSDQLGSTL